MKKLAMFVLGVIAALMGIALVAALVAIVSAFLVVAIPIALALIVLVSLWLAFKFVSGLDYGGAG